MWIAIFTVVGALAIAGIFFLITRFHRFRCLERLAERHKLLSWVLAAVPVAALLCTYFINLFTMFVVVIHCMFIWIVCDFIAWIIRKCRKTERTRNYAGGAALLLTAAVLGAGWFFAHHIFAKPYTFRTEKDLGGKPLRIVAIADSHLGITLDGEKFDALTQRIQAENPDAVVICGDFVDDDSTKADMLAACKSLGGLQTTYGVYYIYGNHDVGYFRYRDFTAEDLRNALTDNGVVMLADESVLLDDRFYLTGRLDRTFEDRKSAQELTESLDPDKYTVMLDHQPNDYAAEAESGADLVISGHTHGGHIFPAGQIGLAIGANDRIYGTETRGDTTFLVTSGVSGWAIPFKTGTISEYCVIDIVPLHE